MPVEFTFGSVGDIITLLQLSGSIVKLVIEIRGTSAEISVLVEDMDTFTHAVQQVQRVMLTPDRISQDVKNGLGLALKKCQEILLKIQTRITKYRSQILGTKGPTIWRNTLAASSWTVFGGKSEVEELRKQLAEQVEMIRLLLSVSQSASVAKLREMSDQESTTLDSVIAMVRDLATRVETGTSQFCFFDEEGSLREPMLSVPLPLFSRYLFPDEDMFADWAAYKDWSGGPDAQAAYTTISIVPFYGPIAYCKDMQGRAHRDSRFGLSMVSINKRVHIKRGRPSYELSCIVHSDPQYAGQRRVLVSPVSAYNDGAEAALSVTRSRDLLASLRNPVQVRSGVGGDSNFPSQSLWRILMGDEPVLTQMPCMCSSCNVQLPPESSSWYWDSPVDRLDSQRRNSLDSDSARVSLPLTETAPTLRP